MSTQPERESALTGAGGHPADSLPARPTAAQRAQQRAAAEQAAARPLTSVPDPEPETEAGAELGEAVDAEENAAEPAAQEKPAPAPKKKTRSAGRAKSGAAQAPPSLSRLEAKQLKKSVSDAAYASAAATRKAQERMDELVETIERAVADGLPPVVIEAELMAACAAAEVELPLDDLRSILRP
ncbi:hypothetical protein IU444_28755 [Nocardia farcinica]|uniref:hypothetical protein n=1 Tax=Nocardia farcinica TaxID=37329 RepID=UPI001894C81D|nr:hypothetical protein [Nocardia farcinica]MBF6388121.1 hypothetical protein [Nocardia farcinica]UEX26381.1 hypothetical protein LMJ57_31005 [Nocardia farcinica]